MKRLLPNIFYYLTIIVIYLHLTPANAQNEWTQKCSQKVSAKEVRLDMLGNIYLTNENSIQKRTICQAESVVYQFPTNGKNMIVDPSNPFKILLFFPNNRRLVFLNNFLSTLNEESLPDFLMSEDVLLMCHSHNNSFWLYNSSQHTLVRYQSNFRRIHETPLQNIVRAPSLIPSQMFEIDEQLFLGIPNHGVLVFDKFGGFKKRIPILYSDFFRYYAGKFYFFKENSLYGYDPVSFEEQALFNSENKILSFDIAKKNIVFLNENQELVVYEIP